MIVPAIQAKRNKKKPKLETGERSIVSRATLVPRTDLQDLLTVSLMQRFEDMKQPQ